MAKRDNKTASDGLIAFLNQNPTAWHVIDSVSALLEKHGYKRLVESEPWKLAAGNKYYVVRHGRAFCAFITPKKMPRAVRIVGSHIDSPGFKLKPHAEFAKENMVMLGLEMYGSPLLTSWLNRDLGIAGRVVYRMRDGLLHESTLNLDGLAVVIPQIAIHLDRNVNENGLVVNKQEHLAAILACGEDNPKKILEGHLKKTLKATDIVSSDLRLFPIEPASYIGVNKEMIASYRIDSLACVYSILEGSKDAQPLQDEIQMIAFWDHEEIGSGTAYGAGSPFLMQTIERMTSLLGIQREGYFQMIARSTCLSVDLCHAIHPNYNDKHEPRHPVFMNKGIVIKQHAQFKYAGDATLIALATDLCVKNKIPHQYFVPRGDILSGTTIGPILSQHTGIRTLDVGLSQLSMHSCRELMGSQDSASMARFIAAFLK